MSFLRIETIIQSPIEEVFDLFRDIKLHPESVAWTNEKVIKGKTEGKFELGDTITWEAVHFGVRQRLTSKIIEMQRPLLFTDEMQKGAFKRLNHKRTFRSASNGTIVTDELKFESPFGIIGKLFDIVILIRYMRRFIQKRNAYIKNLAEHQNI